jgi:hypothetical protein
VCMPSIWSAAWPLAARNDRIVAVIGKDEGDEVPQRDLGTDVETGEPTRPPADCSLAVFPLEDGSESIRWIGLFPKADHGCGQACTRRCRWRPSPSISSSMTSPGFR